MIRNAEIALFKLNGPFFFLFIHCNIPLPAFSLILSICLTRMFFKLMQIKFERIGVNRISIENT